MKIIHVVPHVDEEAAGPTYAIRRLAAAQATAGDEVTLVCIAGGAPIPGVRIIEHAAWRRSAQLAFAPTLPATLRRLVAHADVLHNHSLWAMPNMAAGLIKGRAALVTSPHGTLAPAALRRNPWRKRLFWPLQHPLLRRSQLFVATSREERAQIRSAGLHAPVAVIPLGIDLPPAPPQPSGPKRTLLFLGRVHPIKGIDKLLQAWAEIESDRRFDHWQLDVRGPGDSAYLNSLSALAASLGLKRARFLPAVYGGEKSATYTAADLFVLPSRTENFAVAVAEALAHARPVLVSHGTPWAEVVPRRCGWWVANEPKSLAAAMREAFALPPADLAAMGASGRAWMRDDFAWESQVEKLREAYRYVLGHTPRSACVED